MNTNVFQFIIPRAKMQSNNTITLSAEGDPSTFNMSLKVLKAAGSAGMIEYVKYDFEAASVADKEDMLPSTEEAPSDDDVTP